MYAWSWLPSVGRGFYEVVMNCSRPPPPDRGFVSEVLRPFWRYAPLLLEILGLVPPRNTRLGRLYWRAKRIWKYYSWASLVTLLAPEVWTQRLSANLQPAQDLAYQAIPDPVAQAAEVILSFRWSKIPYVSRFAGPILALLLKVACSVCFFLAGVVLLLLGIYELAWYTSTPLLLASVWATVYVELLKPGLVFCTRFFPKRRVKLQHQIRRLVCTALKSDKQYLAIRSQIDHLPDKSSSLQPLLDDLQSPWLALIHADTDYLVVCVDYYVPLTTGQPTWGSLSGTFLISANEVLVDVLQDELLHRPSSPFTKSLSFRNTRREVAGIVTKHLFPFPYLQHLHRPFRLKAFLPFLITYPGMYFVPPAIPVPWTIPPQILASSAANFNNVLHRYLVAADAAGVPPKTMKQQLSLHLCLFAAQGRAVAAEDKAHEAILEAVLLWKERKNELEKQRFKQE